MSRAIYAELERCIGCHACEVACENEHGGVPNISVDVVDDRVSVPVSCRQCENATCVMACHAEALFRGEDGSVAFDSKRCTGCNLCVLACPFGAIWPNTDETDTSMKTDMNLDLVHRCDLCPGREVPACVLTCPTEALVYGDYEDVAKEARRKAAQRLVRAAVASRVVRT